MVSLLCSFSANSKLHWTVPNCVWVCPAAPAGCAGRLPCWPGVPANCGGLQQQQEARLCATCRGGEGDGHVHSKSLALQANHGCWARRLPAFIIKVLCRAASAVSQAASSCACCCTCTVVNSFAHSVELDSRTTWVVLGLTWCCRTVLTLSVCFYCCCPSCCILLHAVVHGGQRAGRV